MACATEPGLKGEAVQKAPDASAVAQATLDIDGTPPKLTLETFNGGAVLAGSVMKISWKVSEVHPDKAGLGIFHSSDGGDTWTPVATNLDPELSGYSWVVPKTAGTRHKIRLVATDQLGNKGQVESEQVFAIDDDLPTVALLDKPPAVSRSSRVAGRFRASDATSGIGKVVLHGKNLTDKSGYKLFCEVNGAEGAFDCHIPGEGIWGFVLVAVDGAGRASAEIELDPKPEFLAGCDLTPPGIAIKKNALAPDKFTVLNGSGEVEWLAQDNLTPPERLVVRIEYSTDGKTWFAAAQRHPNNGAADIRSSFVPSRKYFVRLVAIDEAGNEAEDTSKEFDPAELPPAGLALAGVEEGKSYPAGGVVIVSWSSPDKSLREATLEVSADGGRTWTSPVPAAGGSGKVTIPQKEGKYHLRAVAIDASGRQVSSKDVSFVSASGAEQVRVTIISLTESLRPVRVQVEPRALARSAKSLRLDVFDGRDWKEAADFKAADMTFTAPAAAGEYAVRVTLKAADDREYLSNEAKFRIMGRAETVGGGIQLQNFKGGEIYAGNSGRLVGIRTSLDPATLRVEYSDASGKDGSWKEVPKEQLQPMPGGLHWKRLPAVTGRTFRLRVFSDDRSASDQSSRDFAIDSKAPFAAVTGPLQDAPIPVRLSIRSEKSISEIRQYTLYVLSEDGLTWVQHDAYDAIRGVVFRPSAPGDYGVCVVARSDAGLSGEPPRRGTPPQAVIKARGKAGAAPEPSADKGPIWLDCTLPDVIKGETPVELRWVSNGTGKVTVSFVSEGKREVIARDQEPAGKVLWNVSKVDAKNCEILLEADGKTASSTKFEIDSTAPGINSVEVEIPKK